MSPPARPRGGVRRRKGTAEAPGADHLVREPAWNGVRRGDPVEVADVGIRGARWEFRSHVTNTRNGSSWVEVVGGRTGDRRIRTFSPDRIYPAPGRRGRPGGPEGPSLADAPQLPLG